MRCALIVAQGGDEETRRVNAGAGWSRDTRALAPEIVKGRLVLAQGHYNARRPQRGPTRGIQHQARVKVDNGD